VSGKGLAVVKGCMDAYVERLVMMHADVMGYEEWSDAWVSGVDAMAGVLDRVACEFGHACLLEVMCRFSELTGDDVRIDVARLQRLADTGVNILG
jgi:hypothetical protein